MATVTRPSASVLKARYPEFTPVPDELVDMVIADAEGLVGGSWQEADQLPAMLALAAHYLAMEGEPARSSGEDFSAAAGALASIKVGDVETRYGPRGAGVVQSGQTQGISDTPYGQRYLALKARNTTSVALA